MNIQTSVSRREIVTSRDCTRFFDIARKSYRDGYFVKSKFATYLYVSKIGLSNCCLASSFISC